MQLINDTGDEEERGALLQAHVKTMKELSSKFSELKSEGKLSGNSTLMADLMLYDIKMLEAMMNDIKSEQ